MYDAYCFWNHITVVWSASFWYTTNCLEENTHYLCDQSLFYYILYYFWQVKSDCTESHIHFSWMTCQVVGFKFFLTCSISVFKTTHVSFYWLLSDSHWNRYHEKVSITDAQMKDSYSIDTSRYNSKFLRNSYKLWNVCGTTTKIPKHLFSIHFKLFLSHVKTKLSLSELLPRK